MTHLAHVEIDLAARVTGSPTTTLSDDLVVCLLHGFGASAQDLVPLSAEIGSVRRWLFPHAPVPITVAGMSYGRAWFPREEEDLDAALFGGYFLSLREIYPTGLTEAAAEVRALIESEHIDWHRLVLGGFSQGAMVAAELLRQSAVDSLPAPHIAVLYSGALVAEAWWESVSPAAQTPNVFQFHGRRDAVLPFEEGQALRQALVESGFTVDWHEFDGGHEIPAGAVARTREILTSALSVM